MDKAIEKISELIPKWVEIAYSAYKEPKPDKFEITKLANVAFTGCIAKLDLNTKQAKAFNYLLEFPNKSRVDVASYLFREDNPDHIGDIPGKEIKKYRERVSNYLDVVRRKIITCMPLRFLISWFDNLNDAEKLEVLKKGLLNQGVDNELNTFAHDAFDLGLAERAISLLELAISINPKNNQAKQKLIEIYPKTIQDVIDEERYEDALLLTEKASELDNENVKIATLRETIKNHLKENNLAPIEKARKCALEFIKEYYPGEVISFDAIWDTLKEFKGDRIVFTKQLDNAFAVTGYSNEDTKKMSSPVIIISMIHGIKSASECPNNLAICKEKILKIASKNKASQRLLSQIEEFIAEIE